MQVLSYLNFAGRCEEAIEFYRRALGAQVEMLLRYKDSPEPANPAMVPAGQGNKIMHAAFRIGDTIVMASDGGCSGQPKFEGVTMSIMTPDPDSALRSFNALADGGTVQMPLQRTFFSPCFGMVADRFGLGWIVNVPGEAPPHS